MGNQAQLDAVKKLIEVSAHLTAPERKEWLDLLPFMNDKQVSELISVLESEPAPHLAALPAAPDEKDLPAPQAASGLPAHASSPPVKPATAAPGGESANSVSAFLNRNFASTLNRRPSVPKVAAPAPKPLAQPSPAVQASSVSATSPVRVNKPVVPVAPQVDAPEIVPVIEDGPAMLDAVPEEVVPAFKSLEDARRLNVTTLRSRGVDIIEKELQALCEKFGYFSVQFALEHAPLYQTYVAIGSRVLKNLEAFEKIQSDLAANKRPFLNKSEFEDVNDLLQRIKAG